MDELWFAIRVPHPEYVIQVTLFKCVRSTSGQDIRRKFVLINNSLSFNKTTKNQNYGNNGTY